MCYAILKDPYQNHKGKRFVVIDEPEEDAVINIGIIKELTGNDFIKGRHLYNDDNEFYPKMKIIEYNSSSDNDSDIVESDFIEISDSEIEYEN